MVAPLGLPYAWPGHETPSRLPGTRETITLHSVTYNIYDSMTSVLASPSDPDDRLSPIKNGSSSSQDHSSSVKTPGPIPTSVSKPGKKSIDEKVASGRATDKPGKKVTKAALETWLKTVITGTATKPGVFEYAGDPTSGGALGERGVGLVEDVGAQSSPLAMVGPTTVIDSLSKEGSSKKEDKWLLKANNRWSILGQGDDGGGDGGGDGGSDGGGDGGGDGRTGGAARSMQGMAKVGVWGVFDGHGGRQAATYASHALYKYMSEFVCAGEEDQGQVRLDGERLELPEDKSFMLSPGFFRQMSKPHNADTFALQVEYMKRLPSAIHKAFLKADEQARKQFQQGGGTTATIAFLCGWQLLVASVGDSQAFLDTGNEVLSVSANHRLEDNEAERARIEEEGGEVAASTVNGKPAGPLRVWPGGLAMSRTIGDVDAGTLCLAEADVVQVTVPKDGARLIIGSDGLWDAVHPKTAAHHTREMTASEASHKLLSMAIKKDRLKDDVTVVVVDILPPGVEEGKMVPGLRLHSPTKGLKVEQAEPRHLARVWRPLENIGCVKWLEEELMRRVDEYSVWREREEERELLARRRKEMIREQQRGKGQRDQGGGGDKSTGKRQPMGKRGSRKSLLDELTNLKLDVESEEWTTVGGGDKKQDERKRENAKKKNANTRNKNRNASNKPGKPNDALPPPCEGVSADGDNKKKRRPPRNGKSVAVKTAAGSAAGFAPAVPMSEM